MYKFVCDVETSGLDYIRNDVLDFTILAIDSDSNLLGEFSSKIRPSSVIGRAWSTDAQKVHGYTPEQAIAFPERRKVLIDLLHFLKPYKDENNFPQEFIFHALRKFDYNFMEWAFRKEGLQYSFFKMFQHSHAVSTIDIAKEITGNKRGHSLDKWAKRINFDLDHHNAKSDTYACLELYRYLSNLEEGDL